MSRSRRKTPIVGHTTCGSEREDKKLWHQRWRTRERGADQRVARSPEHLPLLENQASSVWSMGKDGRSGPSSARPPRRIASPITRDATRKNAPP
jgi:hypothetical protein